MVHLHPIKKIIPHLFTFANLFLGAVACLFAFVGDLKLAFWWVCGAIFFDFFDGFFARLLGVTSELGKQLDSLADLVTSGSAPSLVMFQLFMRAYDTSPSEFLTHVSPATNYLPFFALTIVLASAYRLANFNIDVRQSDSFIGLPTPANALFIMSLPFLIEKSDWVSELLLNPWILLLLTLCSCFILNAPLRMFALKFKNFSFRSQWLRYLFILSCVVLLACFGMASIPLMVLGYVVISCLNQNERQRLKE